MYVIHHFACFFPRLPLAVSLQGALGAGHCFKGKEETFSLFKPCLRMVLHLDSVAFWASHFYSCFAVAGISRLYLCGASSFKFGGRGLLATPLPPPRDAFLSGLLSHLRQTMHPFPSSVWQLPHPASWLTSACPMGVLFFFDFVLLFRVAVPIRGG